MPNSLPHLATFLEATDRGSFSAAAWVLGLSQAFRVRRTRPRRPKGFHGDGPWVINYVNTGEDPRAAKK
jgi:hypothetical protein